MGLIERKRLPGQTAYRIWQRCISVRSGGQATPWPWTEVVISRRRPKPDG